MSDIKKDVREIWMPVGKTDKGYTGILSTNSIDREDEIIGQELLNKWANEDFYIPALVDHKNEIKSNVGYWANKHLVQNSDGMFALKATPVFFESNPNAKIVKGMLEEGGQIGLSIGALPLKSKEVTKSGKNYNEWEDAELVEASFTPIPANRHTYANLAKKFDIEKNVIKKDLDLEIKQPTEEKVKMTEELKKSDEATTGDAPEEKKEEEPQVEEEKKVDIDVEVLKKAIRSDILKELKQDRTAVLNSLKEEMPVPEEISTKTLKPTIANFVKAHIGGFRK